VIVSLNGNEKDLGARTHVRREGLLQQFDVVKTTVRVLSGSMCPRVNKTRHYNSIGQTDRKAAGFFISVRMGRSVVHRQ